MLKKTTCLSICFLLLILTSSFSQTADPVVEAIDEAKSAYLKQDYREAAAQLNDALQVVNQKLIEQLKSFLPEPLKGWEADAPEGGASGLALLSGLNAHRRYYRRGTGKSVEIEILSNAAKIPALRMWLSNPRLMSAEEGTRLIDIEGYRGIEKYDHLDKYAELNFVVGSSMLVVLKGFETRNTDDVKDFAKKMDLKGLETKFP